MKAPKLPSPLSEDDQAEVFSLIDHLPVQADPNKKREKLNFGSRAIQESLVNYGEKKLFDKPHTDEEINLLFEDTIEFLCESVELRFTNSRDLSEFLNDNDNFAMNLMKRVSNG